MRTLHEYINTSPKRPMRAWAGDFGVSRSHLIALINGDRNPSLAVARRIEAETGGEVPVSIWPNFAAVVQATSEATQ